LKAVIMAGGKGTRLRPLTCDKPKPMVPIVNKPMMEHIVELLVRNGFRQIAVTMCYLPEIIEEHFGDGREYGVDFHYYREETPLGTAGSVRNAEQFLDDTFIVISGDALTDFDLSQAVRFHREKGAIATLVLTRVDTPLEYGVVMLDEEGLVQRFLEKPSWGEVFSDTVNTGIYILEPEIFEYFSKGEVFDFSKDLFPILLQEQKPMYGYVAGGYWSDIGNLDQYRQAHIDILQKRVKVDVPGTDAGNRIWIGSNVSVSDRAHLTGPCLIGDNTCIGPGVEICPFTVVGSDSIIKDNASLKRSIVWGNAYLDTGVNLRGAIVCDHARLKAGAAAYEGAVIGKDCSIGKRSAVKPGVKLWPCKSVEAATDISSSLVWSSRWSRSLFGSLGVTGLANVEITPEFAAKLGSAYGTILDPGDHVVAAADNFSASRVLKRALISGLLSTGINVFDLGTASTPVVRYAITTVGAQGGMHFMLSPYEDSAVLVEFFDERGVNLPKGAVRQVENAFFREDFRRVQVERIGELAFLPKVAEGYMDSLVERVDVQAVRKRRFRIVADYDVGHLSLLLPTLMDKLGCRVESIPGRADQSRPRTRQEVIQAIEDLSSSVLRTGADLGIVVDNSGEKLILVDELGNVITDEVFLAIISMLVIKSSPNRTVVVPVTASSAIEDIASRYDGKVIRAKSSPCSLMEKMIEEKIFIGRQGLPHFQPVFDAMVSLAKTLEMLASNDVNLSELVRLVPEYYMKHDSVPCPWEAKGRVMRQLIEQTRDEDRELIDGLKVRHENGWALVLPDSEDPIFNIYSEATTSEEANALSRLYMGKISELL